MDENTLTLLLREAQMGDESAYGQVYNYLHQELKRRARLELNARPANTISATSLVNEVFLKLRNLEKFSINDRRHFLRICVRAMRNILIDHFRARKAEKRGGDLVRADLGAEALSQPAQPEHVLDIDNALNKLRRQNERIAEIVEYKFFLGLSEREIAETLEVTTRTVRNNWRKGRMWLMRELSR